MSTKSKTNVDIFREYRDVQKQIDNLEEAKELLREQLAAMLPEDGVENKYGKFAWSERRVYTYPALLVEREEQIKKEKKAAELTGDATFTLKKTLLVKLV